MFYKQLNNQYLLFVFVKELSILFLAFKLSLKKAIELVSHVLFILLDVLTILLITIINRYFIC